MVMGSPTTSVSRNPMVAEPLPLRLRPYHSPHSRRNRVMLTAALLRRKRDDILRIAAAHGGRDVRVFGSWARDEAPPDSDIDLLIRLDPGRSLLDIIAIKQDLEDLLDRPVDVVTETGLSSYIREQVLREAVGL